MSRAPREFADLLARRVLLVTGKGGVGKTFVAVSVARAAAMAGKRVLLAEIGAEDDAPSPLAATLGVPPPTPDPGPPMNGLRCVRITPTRGHHDFLRRTMPVKIVADAAMRSAAIRRFLAAAPTLGEMGILYRILALTQAQRSDGSFEHELLVVDLPATGHTMALAQLPEAILRVIPGGPIVSAVRDGLAVLANPEKTVTLVVTLPETLPVSEALELVSDLTRQGIPVGGLVLNRTQLDPFTAEERRHVDAWLAAHPKLLGSRSLERIQRAARARERLGERAVGLLVQLPELPPGDLHTERLARIFLQSSGEFGAEEAAS